jgi:hypothetical protein
MCVSAVVSAYAQQIKRTPWGDPDLQGIWPSGSMIEVPFERPVSLGTRAELTESEYRKFAEELAAEAESDASESVPSSGSNPAVTPPSHWLERGKASRQTSLVVDPPDGRLPPMTEDGAKRAADWRARTSESYPLAGPEDLTPYDRCITRGVLGSAFPNIYSTGMQIVQVPGLVVIRYEMIHETRIIPLDGRPHAGAKVRSYMGDARGRWDGATLVVETTNFNGRTGSLGRNGNGNPTSDALKLVERFSLKDANTLEYRVTVDDPKTWSRPWTVAFPLSRDTTYQMFEYACHEGNYAIRNILSGVRAAEKGGR